MNQVEQSVAEYVDEVWEDVVADIEQLVSYPSVAVAADAEPGAPFGRPVRDALDCALGIAQKLGYQTSDDEGFVGIADIPGRGDKQLATICHVDVVPAGPGWNTDPFAMERREGWLLGRGVIDDKGPAVLSLYAGAYLPGTALCRAIPSVRCWAAMRKWACPTFTIIWRTTQTLTFCLRLMPSSRFAMPRRASLGRRLVSPKIDGGRIVSGAVPRRATPFRRSLSASSRLPPMSCRRRSRTPTA